MSQALLEHTHRNTCVHINVHLHTSSGSKRECQPAGHTGELWPCWCLPAGSTALPHAGRRGQVAGITPEGAQSWSCCWAACPGAEKRTWEGECPYFQAVLSQSMCPIVINCSGPSKEARQCLWCTETGSPVREEQGCRKFLWGTSGDCLLSDINIRKVSVFELFSRPWGHVFSCFLNMERIHENTEKPQTLGRNTLYFMKSWFMTTPPLHKFNAVPPPSVWMRQETNSRGALWSL